MEEKCSSCEPNELVYSFIPFPNPVYKSFKDPKYAFHIKQECKKCGHFMSFVKQTPDFMKELKDAALIVNPPGGITG